VKKDLKTAHKGLTVCKYKESNLGPVAGFRALSRKKSSKKMFPFNVQLSGNNVRFLRPKCYFVIY